MAPKRSLRFEDLGLKTPLPSVLASTREQKKNEKHKIKKEKNARLREAEEQLSQMRATIEKHKLYVQKEVFFQKKEKTERKQKLFAIREVLRQEREEKEVFQKEESRVAQQTHLARLAANRAAEEKNEKKLEEIVARETEKIAKYTAKNVYVDVFRKKEIEDIRKELPVLREEQAIVEAINNSFRTCVLICGETGSGKTTQVPQFLWECGYGDLKGLSFARDGAILVTEPRRIAAVSMAKRVAEELNTSFGGKVCYHVRYDNNLSDDFKIKFATEGIVLKEIQSDFLLKTYSVIVVDEAHERSVAGDILIGLLSRIVPLRNDLYLEELKKHGGDVKKVAVKPLKLVIMSATMRVADFKENCRLFPISPPLINVEARRFPVANHFAKRTQLRNYIDEAFKKVCQIHKKLPPGGILLFLSTQHEIESMCQRLRTHYGKTRIEYHDKSYSKQNLLRSEEDDNSDNNEDLSHEKDEFGLAVEDYALDDTNEGEKNAYVSRKRPRDVLVTEEGGDFLSEDEINGELDSLHVLPLYALMDFTQQQEVFKDTPPGKRLCVVATNVAETSITIPNIRYVVDSGRVKTKTIDDSTGASCFCVEWTSQASAEQRSGRAGRMGPGHCYRLYSTAVYSNLMPKHNLPEILRTSLESVVLLMKNLGIDNIETFPFPSPPKENDLKRALAHLTLIGALEPRNEQRITRLGRRLIAYPIPPRFSRVILETLDKKFSSRLLMMVTFIAAIYSTTTSVFTSDGNRLKWKSKDVKHNEETDERRPFVHSLLHPGSDLITSLNALGVYLSNPSLKNCLCYCLVQKSMSEACQLYEQLHVLTLQDSEIEQADEALDTHDGVTVECEKPFDENGIVLLSKDEEIVLRKLFIFGFVDQVARRATVQECRDYGVTYKDNKATKAPYIIIGSSMITYIHPTSSVARTYPPPEYVTFAFLQRSVRSETKESVTMMLGVTIVTREWLLECGVGLE